MVMVLQVRMRTKELMVRVQEVQKMTCNSLYGNFRNPKFTDVWDTSEAFVGAVKTSSINVLDDDLLNTLYYLLYASYGNSVVASSDIEQFKYKVYSIIFMYGPTWAKRLEIQEKLRGLSEDEITTGAKAIYNHAFNPDTRPATSTLDELLTINDQNTTKYKKSKLEAYSILLELLKTDVTKEFINKFNKLFLTVVEPEEPLWYEMEVR
jgi:hypothetical protein